MSHGALERWRGRGWEVAGKWLPAAEPRASTVLVLQPCLSSSWDLRLGFQGLGLVWGKQAVILVQLAPSQFPRPGIKLPVQCWEVPVLGWLMAKQSPYRAELEVHPNLLGTPTQPKSSAGCTQICGHWGALMESRGLEKSSGITDSNHQPGTARSTTEPCA